MVEIVARQHGFPAARGMAGVAGLLEFAAVRIEVTVGADGELHILVSSIFRGLARRIRLVTLIAGHLDVQASEWITGLRMVEILAHFPGFDVVAFRTCVSKLTPMHVFMAGRTSGGLPEKGLRRILVLDEGFKRGKHVRGRMAFFALQVGMLAFEFVAGQPVIEFFFGRFPADEVELLAVMLEVTTYAIFAVRIAHLHLGVVAVLVGEGFSQFLVAIETSVGRTAGAELVAGIALGCAAQ